VVVLEPREPREFAPPAETPVMDQVERQFVPALLVVRAGHPAEFLNNDPELHNLNVKDATTLEQAFNVAIPEKGKYTHTLKAGLYAVSCDIHPTMSALILSTPSPYVAYTDETGAFSLTGVPPGGYVAKAYSAGPTIERTVEVTTERTEIDLR
jgi:plastocyanin